MILIALILGLAWSSWMIYAHYKGATATKGAVSLTMWASVVFGVLWLAFTVVVLLLPDSTVAKWFEKAKAAGAAASSGSSEA